MSDLLKHKKNSMQTGHTSRPLGLTKGTAKKSLRLTKPEVKKEKVNTMFSRYREHR